MDDYCVLGILIMSFLCYCTHDAADTPAFFLFLPFFVVSLETDCKFLVSIHVPVAQACCSTTGSCTIFAQYHTVWNAMPNVERRTLYEI